MSLSLPSKRRAALVIGSMLALVACGGDPSAQRRDAPAASASTLASAAGPTGDSPLSVAKRLALSKPGGSSLVSQRVEKLQKGLEVKDTLPDAWVLLGRAWVRRAREASDPGFYLNAKACADVALDLSPDNRLAKDLVAMVQLNQHRFDDARDTAEQILHQASDDLQALGTQSDAFLEVGRYDEAEKAARTMMDLKPNLPSYSRVSYLEWLRGDEKGALENMRLAADSGQDPKDLEPRCWVLVQAATYFWHKGDYAGADAGYGLALKECQDYPPALAGRGRVALGNGDLPKAIEYLSLSYKASPLPETAWLLGDAKAASGDQKGADESYARVVKDGRAIDKRTLALFYATKDKEHDEAIKLAEEEKKVRADIYTMDALAWALYRAKKIPEAKAAIEKATALGTKDARLMYHAGAIKIAAGEKDAGEKLVKEAIALNPKFDATGGPEAAKLIGK